MGTAIHQKGFYTHTNQLSDSSYSFDDYLYENEFKFLYLADSITVSVIGGNAVYSYVEGVEPAGETSGHLLLENETITINGSENIKNFKIAMQEEAASGQVFITFNAHALTGSQYGWPLNIEAPLTDADGVTAFYGLSYALDTPGVWYGGTPTLTYSWQRSLDEETWEDIPLSGGEAFSPRLEDEGYLLRIKEIANGSAFAYSENPSDAVIVVQNEEVPSIDSDLQVGVETEAANGSWNEDSDPVVITNQWQKSLDGETGWEDIDGATDVIWTPTEDEEGYYIRISETATVGFYAVTVYSDPTDNPVAAA